MLIFDKSAVIEIDDLSAELEVNTTAIRYLFNRLAEVTERDLEQIGNIYSNDNNTVYKLADAYKEAQTISLLLGHFVKQSEDIQTELRYKVNRLYTGG